MCSLLGGCSDTREVGHLAEQSLSEDTSDTATSAFTTVTTASDDTIADTTTDTTATGSTATDTATSEGDGTTTTTTGGSSSTGGDTGGPGLCCSPQDGPSCGDATIEACVPITTHPSPAAHTKRLTWLTRIAPCRSTRPPETSAPAMLAP